MEADAAAAATLAAWEGHAGAFARTHGLLRAKGAEIAGRREQLAGRQAALAAEHGGADVKGSDRLTLNVGGVRVRVLRDTMRQFPGTPLEAMFSGRWESVLLRDKKGRVFLDVSPVCFRKIVDFLNLMKIADPDDPPELPEVAKEDQATMRRLCDFFGLTEALAPPVPEAAEVPPLDSRI